MEKIKQLFNLHTKTELKIQRLNLEIQRLKLFEAIDDDEFDEVKTIITESLPHQRKNLLRATNHLGQNCLHTACMKGAFEICQWLISQFNQ
jgi:hypothetical protein